MTEMQKITMSASSLLAIGLLVVSVSACGRTGKSTAPASTAGYLNDGDKDMIGDADSDNGHDNDHDNSEDHKLDDNGRYHDGDDRAVARFGHRASAADRRAVTTAVKRYYAVATSGDGEKGCSMLRPSVAKAVPEDYGYGSAGPSYLHAGKTCPQVMTLLFRNLHAQLVDPVEVTGVRISGNQAVALLGSKRMPAGDISIAHQGGAWKIGSIMGTPLP
jgi:hypothetical protein